MSGRDIVIVASGGANTASLQFALQRLDAGSQVSADAERIRAASHVILPGVGAAGDAMARLRQNRLDELIPALRQPVLGICLGMQLLFESSEEGDTACLGILPGRARRFAAAADRPVPHMGWNTLDIPRPTPAHDGPRRRRLCVLRAQLCPAALRRHGREHALRHALQRLRAAA